MRNPLRTKVFIAISERPASAKELETALDEPAKAISRTIESLRNAGVAELVEEKTGAGRRGGVERFYRANMRPYFTVEEWDALSLAERRPITLRILQLIMLDAATGLDSDLFDSDPTRHLSRTLLPVDEKGFEDLNSLMADSLEGVLRIQDECRKRLELSGESGFFASAALLSFRRPAPVFRHLGNAD